MSEQQSPIAPIVNGPAAVAVAPIEALIKEIASIPAPEEELQPMAQNFDADLIVIGAGPGGYVAAIRAAQLGASVIVVEKEYLGGTCLNWGCIPSKAMLASAERVYDVKNAAAMGVKVEGEVSVDFETLMKRKQKIVETQRGGIGMLFKKNKIRHVEGTAKFLDKNTIEVNGKDGVQKITAKNFILAMGAKAIKLPIPGLEGGREDGVWTSDDAVTAPYVPKRMLILGGGAVGCEFGVVFNQLGTETTIVEVMPTIVNVMDPELGTELAKSLTKQGIKVKTGSSLDKVQRDGDAWKCFVTKDGKTEEIVVDVVLLGVGRKAVTDDMNLEKIGVKLHKRGVELVDDTMVTHVPNIYAIGDVTGRIQLAHVASHEGTVAAANIVKGANKKVSYKAVPSVVYTSPEVAAVGLTEAEAKERGYDVVVGKANFRIFGKAMATMHTDGFVKVVAERKYGEVLGFHMIGAHVTDLIHEGVIAINLEATLESLADSIHAHPTMAEAILEAVEDALGHAIHKM